jgi:sugar/nucleoside kinase (ribokinase family)
MFKVGDDAILYGRKGAPAKQFTPLPVKMVDSAGAGDSFRAGVAYGLLQNWNDDKIILYASAIAGLVCERFPSVLNSPTLSEVMRVIQRQPKSQAEFLVCLS